MTAKRDRTVRRLVKTRSQNSIFFPNIRFTLDSRATRRTKAKSHFNYLENQKKRNDYHERIVDGERILPPGTINHEAFEYTPYPRHIFV